MAAKTGTATQNGEEEKAVVYHDRFKFPLGGEQQNASGKEGGRKAGKHSVGKMRREKKKPKIKDKANGDMGIPMENQETADLLANAVTNAVDAKIIYTYQTKIEFPVAENTVSFDLRNQFLKLMQLLQKVDREISIGMKQNNMKWDTS
eukprot:1840327-Ditylum_brightwellii.AAC.1